MFKKSIAIIALSLFTTSSITACGSNNTLQLDPSLSQPAADTSVDASSYKGVYKEIGSAAKLAFKEFDKDNNKNITPAEYGVGTADSAKAFYALDNNHDGKITEGEFTPGFFSKVGLTLRLKSAADGLFKQLDKSKDNFVSKDELNSALVSAAFADAFDKYDKQKKTLLHNDKKGLLSKSEFEDLFAHIALNGTPAPAPAPSTAPSEAPPAPPAPPAPTDAPPAPPASPTAAPATR